MRQSRDERCPEPQASMLHWARAAPQRPSSPAATASPHLLPCHRRYGRGPDPTSTSAPLCRETRPVALMRAAHGGRSDCSDFQVNTSSIPPWSRHPLPKSRRPHQQPRDSVAAADDQSAPPAPQPTCASTPKCTAAGGGRPPLRLPPPCHTLAIEGHTEGRSGNPNFPGDRASPYH